MMAVSYNTVIDQGADWYLTVTYENPNGTAINITNYTAALQLRSLPSDATAVLSLTTGSGITITGAHRHSCNTRHGYTDKSDRRR
jgi:hypothetical protein